jgi:uncharacterized protein (DUF1778 family)
MASTETDTDSQTSKTARFEARITAAQKSLLLRAATLTGRSLTDFVVTSAQEAATRTVREHEAMTVSIRDRKAFVAALLQPPAPGARLRKAAERYKRRTAAIDAD